MHAIKRFWWAVIYCTACHLLVNILISFFSTVIRLLRFPSDNVNATIANSSLTCVFNLLFCSFGRAIKLYSGEQFVGIVQVFNYLALLIKSLPAFKSFPQSSIKLAFLHPLRKLTLLQTFHFHSIWTILIISLWNPQKHSAAPGFSRTYRLQSCQQLS